MIFISFMLLFTVVCGWLDARIGSNEHLKSKGVK